MKTIAISEFKSRALQVVSQVVKTKKPVVVTKRGEPVAEVVPFCGTDDKPIPGKLAQTLVFEKDIVSPLGESVWNACR
jgi:prevent-host-death family protein